MAAIAGGLALGGTALLGRATIGRGLNAISRSGRTQRRSCWQEKAVWRYRNVANLGNNAFQKISKTTLLGTRGGARGTMDMRNTGLANLISKQAGIDLNKGTDLIGLGAAAGVGRCGQQQKKIKKIEKIKKLVGCKSS